MGGERQSCFMTFAEMAKYQRQCLSFHRVVMRFCMLAEDDSVAQGIGVLVSLATTLGLHSGSGYCPAHVPTVQLMFGVVGNVRSRVLR